MYNLREKNEKCSLRREIKKWEMNEYVTVTRYIFFILKYGKIKVRNFQDEKKSEETDTYV